MYLIVIANVQMTKTLALAMGDQGLRDPMVIKILTGEKSP